MLLQQYIDLLLTFYMLDNDRHYQLENALLTLISCVNSIRQKSVGGEYCLNLNIRVDSFSEISNDILNGDTDTFLSIHDQHEYFHSFSVSIFFHSILPNPMP